MPGKRHDGQRDRLLFYETTDMASIIMTGTPVVYNRSIQIS